MGPKVEEHGVRAGGLGHGNPAQYNYDAIANFLHGANADPLEGLEWAYNLVGRAFQVAGSGLDEHVRRLKSVWQGDAQELGIDHVKQLGKAANVLAAASRQFQAAMSQAHATIKQSQAGLPAKKAASDPAGALLSTAPAPGPPSTNLTPFEDDKRAQEHLARTNAGLAEAYAKIPKSVTLGRVDYGGPVGGPPEAGGGGSSGAPSNGSGASPAGGAGGFYAPGGAGDPPHFPGGGDGSSGGMPGHSGGHGALPGGAHGPSHLEGLSPSTPHGAGTIPLPPGNGGGAPGSGNGGLGALPRFPGGGSLYRPPAPPSTEGGAKGPGQLPKPMPPRVGEPEIPSVGGGGTAIRPGQAFGPGGNRPGVIGGNSAQSPFQNGRSPAQGAVLKNGTLVPGNSDSASHVGGNATGGPTQAVGGAPGAGAGRSRDHEGERQSWLSDEEGLWNERDDVAPRVIGEGN